MIHVLLYERYILSESDICLEVKHRFLRFSSFRYLLNPAEFRFLARLRRPFVITGDDTMELIEPPWSVDPILPMDR